MIKNKSVRNVAEDHKLVSVKVNIENVLEGAKVKKMPICSFYDAFGLFHTRTFQHIFIDGRLLAWVLTVTEFATYEDRETVMNHPVKFLFHVVQWATTLSHRPENLDNLEPGLCKSHLPTAACIVQSEPLDPGKQQHTRLPEPDDSSHIRLALGFSLSDAVIRIRNNDIRAKEQATELRRIHLEGRFGDLSGDTARFKQEANAMAVEYGQCAETFGLTRYVTTSSESIMCSRADVNT